MKRVESDIKVVRPMTITIKQVHFSDQVKINFYLPEPNHFDTWAIDKARGHRMLHPLVLNRICFVKFNNLKLNNKFTL